MRLNRYLAQCGVDSRRNCDYLISSREIKVNGIIIDDFSYLVKDNDIVQYKNSIISPNYDLKFYLVNKPSGYVCTATGNEGKRVIDLVPKTRRMFTVGRLDRDTTGAIIVTNNGEIANKLMHPRYNIEKTYIVETKIDIKSKIYNSLKSGISIGYGQIAYGQIKRLYKKNAIIYWEVTLTEGKNREVKRIFKAMSSKVLKLHRYSFAGLNVKNIKIGKYMLLTKKQIKKLS